MARQERCRARSWDSFTTIRPPGRGRAQTRAAPGRLLDVVEDVAAPDPVERRVGRLELGGIASGTRDATREARGRPARAPPPRAPSMARCPRRARRARSPRRASGAKSPAPQPTSRPREPSGKPRSAMSARASGSWKRFMRSSDFVNGSVSGWVIRAPPSWPRLRRAGCTSRASARRALRASRARRRCSGTRRGPWRSVSRARRRAGAAPSPRM